MTLSGDAFRTMCRRYRTAWLSAVVGLAAVALLSVIAVQIFSSSDRNADARLAHALRIKGDVETLQAVHVDANSDFLKGLGTSLAASYAWPVSRVGAAVRGYDDLEQAYAGDPASAKVVRQLREATAQWAWRLEGVTAGASRRGPAIEIDSVALLSANEMLSEIAHALAALRMAQDDFLRDSGNEAAQRMASEQTILAIAATASILLLIYGFIANHRAGLARAKVRIVAEEAEIRFRILRKSSARDDDLRRQVPSRARGQRGGGRAIWLHPRRDDRVDRNGAAGTEEIAPFLADLASFIARSSASGSAGVRRHMHRDGTPILVQVSFHFLKYGNRDACFIVAIDVTAHEHAERALRKSKRMLQTVIDTVPHRIIPEGQRITLRGLQSRVRARCGSGRRRSGRWHD